MPPQPSDPNIPDGWEVVQDSPTQAATGTPDGWEVVEDATPAPSNWMGGLSALSAAGAAAVPAAKGLAERIATSPTLGSTAGALASRLAAPANALKQGYDVLTGKQSLTGALGDGAMGEGARRLVRPGVQMLQRGAASVASALGSEGVAGTAAPVAVPLAGGLAGVAGTAGFLGALQHDANRQVTTDYTKNTPDTDIAKVFMHMRNSEANRGRTLDERMDDPNDVMFRPDDQAEVRAAVIAALGR
jgi:hypothetical protein